MPIFSRAGNFICFWFSPLYKGGRAWYNTVWQQLLQNTIRKEGAILNTSITSSDLRILNRRKVLDAVYAQRALTKQRLVQDTAMSLPTITQNLKEFEALGLIERRGCLDSTGGRKAQLYHFVAAAKIAIGVLLLKEGYHVVAVDLYGQTLKTVFCETPFARTTSFFSELGTSINTLIAQIPCRKEQILGVAIAVQGLVSPDGQDIFYGEIMNCTGLTLSEIQQYIDYPCSLIHDTEATAMAELWDQKGLENAVLLSLSRNFSGILIINGKVHKGETLSGTIEHMRLHPGGHPCYCGKRGCIEAYCSSNALLRDTGESLAVFFEHLRRGDSNRQKTWQNYLQDLALAINNVRMVVDQQYIISGYLLKFMNDEDFALLAQYVKEDCSFSLADVRIRRSAYSEDVAACGAAISLVKSFMASL